MRSILRNASRFLVGGAQATYRRLHPGPPPTQAQKRADYLFKHIVVEDIPVHTEDDFRLTITNKRPRNPSPNLCPVFCLPGLCETRFVLDQALGNSLVDYLALSGFDVYVGELRGHGKSWHPRSRYDWNVDSYLRFDLPAMLHRVRQVSGHDQVIWIGHSMGGMLLYAYLISAALHGDPELFDEGAIRAGVTIGSPVSFDQPSLMALSLWYRWSPWLRRLPMMPTGHAANLLSLFPFLADSPLTAHFWNWRNIETRNKILYLKDGLDDISQGVLNDFAEYVLHGDFQSSDRRINYRKNLYLVKAPLLIIGGTGDLLASRETVETVFREVSSRDKEVRLFGVDGCQIAADGARVEMKDQIDYGHVDLTLGRHSKSEVWPYILAWVRERALIQPAGMTDDLPAPIPLRPTESRQRDGGR